MTKVSIKDAKNRFTEFGRAAEGGETITVTRNGKPAFVIGPLARKTGGIDWKAGEAFKRKHGIKKFFSHIAPDFDEPLPEDFLITPLPKAPIKPKRLRRR